MLPAPLPPPRICFCTPARELKWPSGGTWYGQAPWNAPPPLAAGLAAGAAAVVAAGAGAVVAPAAGVVAALGALVAGGVVPPPQAASRVVASAPVPRPSNRRRLRRSRRTPSGRTGNSWSRSFSMTAQPP